MADIVAMSAYRSVHDRLRRKRQSALLPLSGPATLLLFTGVRREPIGTPSSKLAGKKRKGGGAAKER
ncbi:MAG: hypothetical protein ABL307_01295 [Roseitalea porphyridii]|uniref:hypothetical protein n=1 Tax=Roseitalea porphyridii TaxID=1852022 RepID=UPI0032D95BD4